jgi:multiple sugar transport system permease protein
MSVVRSPEEATAGITTERPAPQQRPGRPKGRFGERNAVGWLFVSPTLIVLGVFLVVPIVMALWVSFSSWNGRGSPFAGTVGFVGLDNYARLLAEEGLTRSDFMTSLRNTFYYVLLVVPAQTVFALFLATVLNNQLLKARGFFRTAFYFPSVTSSVAISVIFLFLFAGSGAVNTFLEIFGIDGPTWFADARGLLHLAGDGLGLWDAGAPPESLSSTSILGLSAWQWLAGPSVALSVIMMLVVWTTTGTFMLMFLAALQDVPVEVEEAARVDGANRWQSFRAGHPAAPASHCPARRHARHHRHLAGLRPGVRHDAGRAEQDDAHPCVPVVLLRLRQPAVGRGRRHGVRALPHHLRPDRDPAAHLPRQGRPADQARGARGGEAGHGARAGRPW